jgi:hypothetical protein
VHFVGNGQNIVYVDSENDLLVVVRWIKNDDALNTFWGPVIAAIKRYGSPTGAHGAPFTQRAPQEGSPASETSERFR